MFRQLMNFSYQRTALQAVGWYLTFFLIGIFIEASTVTIFWSFDVLAVLLVVRFLIMPAYVIALGFALARFRWTRPEIGLALLAPLLLSIIAGLLAGLIPLAVLTTRPIQKPPAEIGEVFK